MSRHFSFNSERMTISELGLTREEAREFMGEKLSLSHHNIYMNTNKRPSSDEGGGAVNRSSLLYLNANGISNTHSKSSVIPETF